MNKKPQTQSRSKVVIILAILAIALLGVLGFMFWQNSIDNKPDTAATNLVNEENEVNTDPYSGWNEYESINSKYSIKYPKDWIALKETPAENLSYIRNFEPTSESSQGGYPDGYINMQILREENNANFKAMTGYTTTNWFKELGDTSVKYGAVSYSPEDVKEMKISGLPAKSAKSIFTETNEVIYALRGENLYSISLCPYGASTDPTVKLVLDSFRFTY